MIPPLKSGGSTLESGYPSLESCYFTSEGAPATESGGLLPLCPFYHTSECPPATESELPHRNPSRSTSGVGCSYLCNRVVPPLMVLLPLYPCYPTSEGAPATEFGPFYHRIRTATQEPELFHIIRNRAIPPLNPARNLKSQGEFTASRQI